MLGVLVTIHELGHFLVAKSFKVYVFEFAIGFGPKVLRKKKGETYYSLRLLPLGGYVAMLGEEDAIPEEFAGEEIDKSRSLVSINRGKRAAIMSAGVIMNLVLGYLIFLFSNGVLNQTGLSRKLSIKEDSYAASIGIKSDDWLVPFVGIDADTEAQYWGKGKINDEAQVYYILFRPYSFKDLDFGGDKIGLVKVLENNEANIPTLYVPELSENDTLVFDVLVRSGSSYDADDVVDTWKTMIFTTELINTEKPSDGYQFNSLGLSLTAVKYRNSFPEAFKLSNQNFVSSVTAVGQGLASLFTSGLDNVSGPVGIFTLASDVLADQGVARYLFLWGLISVNLAIFNLLPFPPLDGWHLLVVTVEAITRKEINPKFKQIATMIGSLLLILLTILILGKDLFSLVGVLM